MDPTCCLGILCFVTQDQGLVGFSSLHLSISVWRHADVVSREQETTKRATLRKDVDVNMTTALFSDFSGQMGASTRDLGTSSWPILCIKVS